MKHLIGIVSNAFTKNNEFGIDFEKYKKVGIDALDFQGLMSHGQKPDLYNMSQDEFISYFERLRFEIDKNGLRIIQLHSLWDPSYKNTHEEKDIFIYHEKALLAASILKAKYVVFHTIPCEGHYIGEKVEYEKLVDTNKVFFNRLLPVAKRLNVYIAIENLPFFNVKEFFSPSGTLKFVRDMNDSHVVMCLDTGHFNMFKEEKIYVFLLEARDKLGCLHIHDNNGLSDSHLIPYLGNFDWKMFIKGLKEINFAGVLSLETKIQFNGMSIEALELLKKSMIKIIKDIRDELDD